MLSEPQGTTLYYTLNPNVSGVKAESYFDYDASAVQTQMKESFQNMSKIEP